MTKEELINELKNNQLTIDDLKQIMLNNFVDEYGNLDLSGLDFSDFDKDVIISRMKVKGNLWQEHQIVGKNLNQFHQKVSENLYQEYQIVKGNLFQCEQEVKRNLYQDYQEVNGDLYQNNQQNVKGKIYND